MKYAQHFNQLFNQLDSNKRFECVVDHVCNVSPTTRFKYIRQIKIIILKKKKNLLWIFPPVYILQQYSLRFKPYKVEHATHFPNAWKWNQFVRAIPNMPGSLKGTIPKLNFHICYSTNNAIQTAKATKFQRSFCLILLSSNPSCLFSKINSFIIGVTDLLKSGNGWNSFTN